MVNVGLDGKGGGVSLGVGGGERKAGNWEGGGGGGGSKAGEGYPPCIVW